MYGGKTAPIFVQIIGAECVAGVSFVWDADVR